MNRRVVSRCECGFSYRCEVDGAILRVMHNNVNGRSYAKLRTRDGVEYNYAGKLADNIYNHTKGR